MMGRTTEHTRQDYKTIEEVSELNINPVLKKIQNYRHILIQHVWKIDRDRLPHLLMKCQP
jgi:hypothetical protein